MEKRNYSAGIEREKALFLDFHKMNNIIWEILKSFKEKRLTKEMAEESCLRIIEETENSLFLKKEDWGEEETKEIWRSSKVWMSSPFFKNLRLCQKEAEKKEMTLLSKKLKSLDHELWEAMHGKSQKTLLQRVKKYILRRKERRNSPFC